MGTQQPQEEADKEGENGPEATGQSSPPPSARASPSRDTVTWSASIAGQVGEHADALVRRADAGSDAEGSEAAHCHHTPPSACGTDAGANGGFRGAAQGLLLSRAGWTAVDRGAWPDLAADARDDSLPGVYLEYQYFVRKPSQLNKLWDLATWDNVIPGTPWKRGAGAQLLHLSQAACRRGRTSLLISSVAGNVCVRLRAPKDQRAMPTFRMVFTVLTLDQQNHILWNQDFAPGTAAALRKLVEGGRRAMVSDPLYPTSVTLVAELPHAAPTNTVWDGNSPPALLLTTGGMQG